MRVIMLAIANGSKRIAELASPPTLAVLVGIATCAVGLFWIFPPLAFVAIGVGLIAFGAWLLPGYVPKRDE